MRMTAAFVLVLNFLACGATAEQKQLSVEMVDIPGGTFMMGSALRADERPREVWLSAFQIAAYEVTVGLWREFTEDMGIAFPWEDSELLNWTGLDRHDGSSDDLPMQGLTWYDAVLFCNWLSRRDGLTPAYRMDERELILKEYDQELYIEEYESWSSFPEVRWDRSADGYRLPTEAEWEYAATAGGTAAEVYPREELIERAWYRENSDRRPHPVGLKKSNFFGLYDMLGNAAEWTWDFYRADYHAESPLENPSGPEIGYAPDYEYYRIDPYHVRVVRGGSWWNTAEYVRYSSRSSGHVWARGDIGIRLARGVLPEE